jgi:hypothetical protein
MDYSEKFKIYLNGSKVDDFFGKIFKKQQIFRGGSASVDSSKIDSYNSKIIGSYNNLLLAASSKSKHTDSCFCNWSKDKIFELKSFDGFQMRGEQKINIASKICKPFASQENISELFDIMYDSIGKDILLVFNMKGAGATVPKHFHMQVFHDLESSEVFRLLTSNLEVSDFAGDDEKNKWFDYDLQASQLGMEEFFDVKKLNTPVQGLNFALQTKWASKLENSIQLRDFVKDAFCNIMQHFFSRVTTEIFAFNFLFYSGLNSSGSKKSNKFDFNIILRNPSLEQGFRDNVLGIDFQDSFREEDLLDQDMFKLLEESLKDEYTEFQENRWGWLESVGGIRLSEEILSRIAPILSPEILEIFYRRQNRK